MRVPTFTAPRISTTTTTASSHVSYLPFLSSFLAGVTGQPKRDNLAHISYTTFPPPNRCGSPFPTFRITHCPSSTCTFSGNRFPPPNCPCNLSSSRVTTFPCYLLSHPLTLFAPVTKFLFRCRALCGATEKQFLFQSHLARGIPLTSTPARVH